MRLQAETVKFKINENMSVFLKVSSILPGIESMNIACNKPFRRFIADTANKIEANLISVDQRVIQVSSVLQENQVLNTMLAKSS